MIIIQHHDDDLFIEYFENLLSIMNIDYEFDDMNGPTWMFPSLTTELELVIRNNNLEFHKI